MMVGQKGTRSQPKGPLSGDEMDAAQQGLPDDKRKSKRRCVKLAQEPADDATQDGNVLSEPSRRTAL